MNEIWPCISESRNSISDHWLIASCLWNAVSIPLENRGSLRMIPNDWRRLRSISECDFGKLQAHNNLILCLSGKMLMKIAGQSIKKLRPCCFNTIGFSRAFTEKICTQEFTLYVMSMQILCNSKIDISFQTVFNL